MDTAKRKKKGDDIETTQPSLSGIQPGPSSEGNDGPSLPTATPDPIFGAGVQGAGNKKKRKRAINDKLDALAHVRPITSHADLEDQLKIPARREGHLTRGALDDQLDWHRLQGPASAKIVPEARSTRCKDRGARIEMLREVITVYSPNASQGSQ
ncbi:unnamed protein product [Peniophora sp. CBMAI 1063]|nr:unnamed protein product [Peniophora sp. CBMAI 1063]